MIIEIVGIEIEKIKGDFESYLNGLNMVGAISYSLYSKLYDEGTKQIQRAYELGKSDLEKKMTKEELEQLIKTQNRKLRQLSKECDKAINRVETLEKENQALFESNCNVRSKLRTLRNDYEVLDTHYKLMTEENAELKELLNEFMRISKASDEDFEHDYSELIGKTEQFLNSEVEK